jgi:hypothetical protein
MSNCNLKNERFEMLFYGGITLHRLIFNVQQIQTESAS